MLHRRKARCARLNASFANTGYLGIPLVTVAYGEAAALPAALATVATNFVSFALAIVCLELFVNPHRGGCAGAAWGDHEPAHLADRFGGPAGCHASEDSDAGGAPRYASGGGRRALRALRHRPLCFPALDPRWRGGELANHRSEARAAPAPDGAAGFCRFEIDPCGPRSPSWARPSRSAGFVLAQRYQLLEAETSTGAVVSTAASLLTVSLVMALLG